MEEEAPKRYRNSIDTLSLTDLDQSSEDIESVVIGNVDFVEIMKGLPTHEDKFVALGLYCGFQKEEIAYMCSVHPSHISRAVKKMKVQLSTYRKTTKSRV